MTGRYLTAPAMATALILVALPLVIPAPLSEMKQVTLHVRSEILDDHKIVITVEPLGNDSKKSIPIEFHDTADVHFENRGKSAQSGKVEDAGVSGENATLENSTELPGNSSSPSNVNETSSVATTSLGVDVTSISPPGDIQPFIVTFPIIKCPSGQKQDPNGVCRDIFFSRNTGKSMDSFNFLFDGKNKNHSKKYWNKFSGA